MSVAVLALLGYTALPWLRSSRSTRFFVTGAILSVFPFGGTFPSDRYLFWAGLGVMGLIAQLVVFKIAVGDWRAYFRARELFGDTREWGRVVDSIWYVQSVGAQPLDGAVLWDMNANLPKRRVA